MTTEDQTHITTQCCSAGRNVEMETWTGNDFFKKIPRENI